MIAQVKPTNSRSRALEVFLLHLKDEPEILAAFARGETILFRGSEYRIAQIGPYSITKADSTHRNV